MNHEPHEPHEQILFKEECYRIQGAIFEINRVMGQGFLEVVELKTVKELTNEHRAQVINYLKATGLKLGLLVNFGHHRKAEIERIVQ